jgi:glycosyltransferase involved in cell wall biosynthesis
VRDTLTICGPGKTMVNTWRSIDRQRFHLTIAATRPIPGRTNLLLDELARLGAETVALPIGRGIDVNTVRLLVQLIRRRRIDILQTHDAQTRRVGTLAAAITGVRHLTSVHGWIFNDQKQRAAKWLDARVIRMADRVIAVSEALRQQLELSGVARERIIVLKNAILLDDYRTPGVPSGLKAELRIPAEHSVVSIIGRLSAEKGHEVFLQAAALVAKEGRPVTFVIVGDGPMRGRLAHRVQELGLAHHVRLAGHRSDMSDVYAMTDVLAISSYTEGIPNVLLEAFAYGRPAVATDVGGVAEVLSDGKDGYLVAAGDVRAMAGHLADLLTNDSLRQRMGAFARASVESRFSFDRRTEALEHLYCSVYQPSHALAGVTS